MLNNVSISTSLYPSRLSNCSENGAVCDTAGSSEPHVINEFDSIDPADVQEDLYLIPESQE